MRYLTPIPKQFVDQSGIPYSDGTVSVYLSGSDELADIFEDAEGDALCPNPCRLDSNGAWQCFVPGDVPLDYIVQDKHGNVVFPYYNIVPASGGSGGGSGTPVSVEGTVGEIDVDENTEGGVKHFVVGLAATIKNAIATLQLAVNSIGLSLNGKKDKQTPVNESGATTKTIVGITQDDNGEISTEFDDIDYTPANRNIAPEYSPSETYPIIGTLCIHDGLLYRSKVEINTAESWTEDHWEVTDISSNISNDSDSNIDIDFIRPVFVQQLTTDDNDLNYDARLDNLLYKLPSGYKKVSGVKNISNITSQQINTGISTDDGIDIELITAFFINGYVQYGQIIGNLYVEDNAHYFSVSCGSSANTVNCFVNTNYTSIVNKSFQNGSSICLRQTGQTRIAKDCYYPFNSYLSTSTTGDANTSSIKMFSEPLVTIYSLYIKKGGVVVRDFIPCVRLSDNAAGFYDKISKSFFTCEDPSKLEAVY